MSDTVRLLDSKSTAVSRLPAGSLQTSAGPFAVIPDQNDFAEWDEGPYHIVLRFQRDRVSDIEITRAQRSGAAVQANIGLAMRFAPEAIDPKSTTSTVADQSALTNSTVYEWARGSEIIRLNVSTFRTAGPAHQADELDRMHWSVTADPARVMAVPGLIELAEKLIKELQQLGHELDAAGDLRGGFAEVHTCMARGITDMARNKRFQDPAWVLRLNIAFIEMFLDQWRGWKAAPERSPEAWRTAFEVANAIQHQRNWPGGHLEETARDRVILIMAGAHILHDIPVCLNRVGCGPEADFRAIEMIVEACEHAKLGDVKMLLKDVGIWLKYPGANAIKDWRNAVWNYCCRKGPHPSQVFR